ncbi:protein UXT homolog isoform X2 [Stegodyphus dumicola]|uniref:protein UXT homolog isoform X2 n=1 Tax=Stegodyphus dumicola TaxID=202533 RepID=UPI0015AB8539|nr:protein UXT homolog isoform X2 [Stegodyphus dumicola]
MALMQDNESNDFSDSDYEEVDIENSGSHSSVCSLIEDDSSSDLDSNDLPAARQWCTIQKTKLPPAPAHFIFTANTGSFSSYDVMTEEKIIKFEAFINDVLREHLKQELSEKEKLCQEVTELEKLKIVIERIKETQLDKQTFKTRVDLGCNFYVQANVTDTKFIFIKTGLDIFVQFTLDEAPKFIDKKIDFLNKKIERSLKRCAEISAHIQLVLQALRELQNLDYTTETPRREVL